jgi:hypothetical protein
MSEKIKVRILVTQEITYDQTVEMTRSEFDKLSKLPDKELENGDMSPLTMLLDLRDVAGWGDFEIEDFSVVKAAT